MRNDLVSSAARNNALWCDAVCRVNGKAGEFQNGVWLNRYGSPRFYPDAVTLAGAESAPEIFGILAELFHSNPGRGWSIKDSFNQIDFRRLGFEPLFDAQWLRLENPSETKPAILVQSEEALIAWATAWAGADEGPGPSPFKPALLQNPDIVFASVEHGDMTVGGGVLNRGAGVTGISNVFADAAFIDTVWQQMTALAGKMFPGLPVVGYERELDLEAACRNGFRPIGDLRVWYRPG